MTIIQKPFLKWVGDKTKLLDNILKEFPKECNNYHDLFLGGGSVLFALLSFKYDNRIKIYGSINAYDLNRDLINLYKDIQSNKEELFEFVDKYIKEYDSILGTQIDRYPSNITEALTSKESYYYWMRQKYNSINKDSVEKSALFLIINRTCFKGIYREGPNGFNVPYGHPQKTPHIFTKEELDDISNLIKHVNFYHMDFKKSIKKPEDSDFVYLDPPYAPKEDKPFVKDNKYDFDLKSHKKLFKLTKNLDIRNIKFIMSNSKVELVLKSFSKFNINTTTDKVIIYN